jgi:hypothetical protein
MKNKNKNLNINELVGGDIYASSGDKPFNGYSEIETGPVQKSYNDYSDYEKGQSTTTDKVFGRYRQNIPWFAVYTYGGMRSNVGPITFESKIINKKTVEETIDSIVKKRSNNDIKSKDDNPKFNKILDLIDDINLTDEQIKKLKEKLNKDA